MNALAQPNPQDHQISASTMAAAILDGDLAKMNDGQRVEYMLGVCRSMGLNPTTKPFEFLRLNGRIVMYAKRDCTEQLRKIHGVSLTITARETLNTVYVVTAHAQDKTGRTDESTGAVPIAGLNGEVLANAMMKAETKAKRRVTLSICGLGILDESEADSIEGAKRMPLKVATETGEVKTKKPEWSEEQKTQGAELRAKVSHSQSLDDEFSGIVRTMKYDEPEAVLRKLRAFVDERVTAQVDAPAHATIESVRKLIAAMRAEMGEGDANACIDKLLDAFSVHALADIKPEALGEFQESLMADFDEWRERA